MTDQEREALEAAAIEQIAAFIYGEVGPTSICAWESVDEPSKVQWRAVARRLRTLVLAAPVGKAGRSAEAAGDEVLRQERAAAREEPPGDDPREFVLWADHTWTGVPFENGEIEGASLNVIPKPRRARGEPRLKCRCDVCGATWDAGTYECPVCEEKAKVAAREDTERPEDKQHVESAARALYSFVCKREHEAFEEGLNGEEWHDPPPFEDLYVTTEYMEKARVVLRAVRDIEQERPTHYPTPVSQRMKSAVRAEQVKLDTERPGERAIEVAAKARWEAACAHHRAEGKEHPTWDEVGTGDWAPYPKDLLLVWERVAVEAFLSVWGTERPEGQTTHALVVEALDEIGLVRVEIDLAESPYLLAVSQARNLGELLIEAADKLTHAKQEPKR